MSNQKIKTTVVNELKQMIFLANIKFLVEAICELHATRFTSFWGRMQSFNPVVNPSRSEAICVPKM